MKKQKISPLDLDKETIARLDEQQLRQIVGGVNDDGDESQACETACTCGGPGATVCEPHTIVDNPQ